MTWKCWHANLWNVGRIFLLEVVWLVWLDWFGWLIHMSKPALCICVKWISLHLHRNQNVTSAFDPNQAQVIAKQGSRYKYKAYLLHQQIFKNLEIYPKKLVICHISDPYYQHRWCSIELVLYRIVAHRNFHPIPIPTQSNSSTYRSWAEKGLD